MTQTAKTYGDSLYALAQEESLTDRIREDLALVQSLLRENPDYLRLLCAPSLPKQERRQLLDEAFRGSIHLYTLNFLKILCDNGTLSHFKGCCEQFRIRDHRDRNILDVCAVSAVPLRPELREKLCGKLAAMTGKTVELQTRVDESILGGIRLELPDRELDGTVQHHLRQLQKQLHTTVL